MKFRLSEAKRAKYSQNVDKILTERRFLRKDLLKLVGRLTFCTICIGPAALVRTRELSIIASATSKLWRIRRTDLSKEAFEDLKWWRAALSSAPSKSFCPTPPSARVETDASNTHGGAICFSSGGSREWSTTWRGKEAELHITAKETLAAIRALQAFLAQSSPPRTVLLMSDSTVACKWVLKSGTRAPKLIREEARKLADMLLRHKHTVIMRHVPGRLNWTADRLSRPGSYALDQGAPTEILLQASRRWGAVERDLSEAGAELFMPDWSGRMLLIPPYKLLGRVTQRLHMILPGGVNG
ncbi:RNase H [Carpediemonas membranifera]|uniref:RNase H n=1 Tax=Carpediemonas membranifera TaxID=201153 RepID=A0A8J6B6N4_9EUKA|nr:RNase H [Carpediemonas membranifera]|eukprot:KAG9396783.1 RNase H [Carpediemonas membranifera]